MVGIFTCESTLERAAWSCLLSCASSRLEVRSNHGGFMSFLSFRLQSPCWQNKWIYNPTINPSLFLSEEQISLLLLSLPPNNANATGPPPQHLQTQQPTTTQAAPPCLHNPHPSTQQPLGFNAAGLIPLEAAFSSAAELVHFCCSQHSRTAAVTSLLPVTSSSPPVVVTSPRPTAAGSAIQVTGTTGSVTGGTCCSSSAASGAAETSKKRKLKIHVLGANRKQKAAILLYWEILWSSKSMRTHTGSFSFPRFSHGSFSIFWFFEWSKFWETKFWFLIGFRTCDQIFECFFCVYLCVS